MGKIVRKIRAEGFDNKNLYYQWLHYRRAQPIGINKIIVPILWVIVVLVLLGMPNAWLTGNQSMMTLFFGISIWMVVLTVIIGSFLDFFLFAPKAISDDAKNSMLHNIFITPISSSSIVSDLRLFIVRQNLLRVVPSIVLILAIVILEVLSGHSNAGAIPVLIQLTAWAIFSASIWWYLLEMGMIAAAIHNAVSVYGAIFITWIIFSLLLNIIGGFFLSTFTQSIWYDTNLFDYLHDHHPDGHSILFSIDESLGTLSWSLILLITAAAQFLVVPMLMKLRREMRLI